MSPDPTPDDAIAAWLTTPEQAARISPTLDLAELRRLAEAATPGPWYGADELSLLIENERATEDIPFGRWSAYDDARACLGDALRGTP